MDLSYTDEKLFRKMLGVYIRESREERQMSLESLSRMVSIPVKKLKQIELGQVACRATTIKKFEAVLDLKDSRLERMLQVARTSYVGEFMDLMWAHAEPVEG